MQAGKVDRVKSSKTRRAFLVASYISDWVILVVAAAVGYVLGNITPNQRPFNLDDREISFPLTPKETVTTTVLVLVSVVAPVAVVFLVCLIFVPGPTTPKGIPRALRWRRKLWELHIGWLSLALSVVGAWFITSCMKNLFGKPRPDLLARCQPDLSRAASYLVGGFRDGFQDGQLVSAAICRNTDKATLNEGFRSFPSGHSSISAAGLIYLSLFLASKFAIAIPFLAPARDHETDLQLSAFPSRSFVDPTASSLTQLGSRAIEDPATGYISHPTTVSAVRRRAAAPPLYLLVIAIIPFFAAIFIASTRWYDFRHHGFDILFGFGIGTVTAFFSFRYYHLPIRQGAGWAWGPRNEEKAFWAGLGSQSYATTCKRLDTCAGEGRGVV